VDAVLTELGWFEVVERPDGSRRLVLREVAPGETAESIRAVTQAAFDVDPVLREIGA
jgi:acyl CoA:acetate/3-ketoacid CoA transferase beta subunit